MKNLSKFLIVAFVIACCCETACNKQENPVLSVPGNISSPKSLHTGSGAVFIVSPSSGLKDSKALNDAFAEAISSGPGSTVQLTEGIFYLDERIEIEGFEGIFRGAGIDKTIITTNDPVDFSDVEVGDAECLIKFRHGKISISDMTITISNPTPGTGLYDNEWWNYAIPVLLMITGNSGVDPGAAEQSASATVDKVKFVGGDGNFGFNSRNLCYFIMVGWDGFPPAAYSTTGNFKISACEFVKGYNGVFTYLTNGPVIIGGDVLSGNKFEEMAVPIGVFDVNGSSCDISFNSLKKSYSGGVILWQGSDMVDASELSTGKFMISNNYIETTQYSPEVELWTLPVWLVDYGFFAGSYQDTKMDIVVTNNKISLGEPSFMAVLGECISNSIISNNIISGSSVGGIAAGLYDNAPIGWEISTGLVLKGNNLQGLDVSLASIVLGAGTNNCLVAGGPNRTNVLDEGTGNILTGVNMVQGNTTGQVIKDAMMKKHEMIRSFRSLR